MRTTVLVITALSLLPLLPTLHAGSVSGHEPGVSYGTTTAVGLWDLYYATNAHATPWSVTFTETWGTIATLASDYDILLYRPGSLDDGFLDGSELLASAEHHGTASHTETLTYTLAPSQGYVVAVVPYKAQGEGYVLSSPDAFFQKATSVPAPGIEVGLACPPLCL